MFRNLTYILLAAAALVAGVMLYQLSATHAEPKLALVYPQPRALADFSLTDQHGERVNRERLYGQWTLAFVGYTYCPDICPLTLAKLAGVQPDLAAMVQQPLKVWFISVDPKRDTAELLKAYMANFGSDFVALRPTPEQLTKVTKDFKIYYKKVEGKTPTSYTMDHSAGSFTFDPQGRIRLYNRHASGAEALAADVKILLSGK